MLKQKFVILSLLYWGKKKLYGKLNKSEFQYSLELPPSKILCFAYIIFRCVAMLFTNFSNPHVPTLVISIFVKAGSQQ